jgi:hypothetical protein
MASKKRGHCFSNKHIICFKIVFRGALFCASVSACRGLVSRPATSPTQPDCSANLLKSRDHIANLASRGPHGKTAKAAQTCTHRQAGTGSFSRTMT